MQRTIGWVILLSIDARARSEMNELTRVNRKMFYHFFITKFHRIQVQIWLQRTKEKKNLLLIEAWRRHVCFAHLGHKTPDRRSGTEKESHLGRMAVTNTFCLHLNRKTNLTEKKFFFFISGIYLFNKINNVGKYQEEK